MSITNVPATYRHKVQHVLPLQKIRTSNVTTDPITTDGADVVRLDYMDHNGLDPKTAPLALCKHQNAKSGYAIVNSAGLGKANKAASTELTADYTATEWQKICVNNPFDPLPGRPHDTELEADVLHLTKIYRKYRVMKTTIDFYFQTTADQGHDNSTRFHLPALFGVNKIYYSSNKWNPSILAYRRLGAWSDDTVTGVNIPGNNGLAGPRPFHLNDYMLWDKSKGHDVCVGGGWRKLYGGDAPMSVTWDRFTHYYDTMKWDQEWSEILYNNTLQCNLHMGLTTGGQAFDKEQAAYINGVPYMVPGNDEWPTESSLSTYLGERPIFYQPYAIAPGHRFSRATNKDWTGSVNHPSIDIDYITVVTYDVEFSEPIDQQWAIGKSLFAMSELNTAQGIGWNDNAWEQQNPKEAEGFSLSGIKTTALDNAGQT